MFALRTLLFHSAEGKFMTKNVCSARATFIVMIFLFVSGCSVQKMDTSISGANGNAPSAAANAPAPTSTPFFAQTTPSPQTTPNASTSPITLPLLDAMFADDSFTNDVKTKLQLSDDQIARIRAAARQETQRLNESNAGRESAADARQRAVSKVSAIIGADKTNQLFALAQAQWQNGATPNQTANNNNASSNASDNLKPSNESQPNAVPTDTRIVVNIPAYRMDVFENGNLIKTYKVGIGYPEFPLPTGMRKATTIIFNPTWTPPDEPWVKNSSKVKAGEKIEAGSSLNPLGPIKIPIGAPSLIHGGKSPAKIGTFASHGCVGLTSPQVQRFAQTLAQVSGTDLTQQQIIGYAKNPTKTQNVKLNNPMPVELRYETIVVTDGKLHIYRDVYGYGTNTEENLRRVLQTYGVSLDQLSPDERAQVLNALQQMARDAHGKDANKNPRKQNDKSKSAGVTRSLVGRKEIVIALPELAGKGYPAPVNLDTGGASPQQPNAKRAANKIAKTKSKPNSTP
jgi:lipoprotein-anchoring transpeptidase ErfK/SrfK